MGLPLVVADARGCREVVVPGRNGELVPILDPSALAAALQRLCDDPDLRAQQGQASRELAHERFDERRIVATVLTTYRSVATAKGLDLGLAS
jgi:glycosyltransferase involved in cell wall biosynthesis